MKISTFYKSTIMLLHHRTIICFYVFFNICTFLDTDMILSSIVLNFHHPHRIQISCWAPAAPLWLRWLVASPAQISPSTDNDTTRKIPVQKSPAVHYLQEKTNVTSVTIIENTYSNQTIRSKFHLTLGFLPRQLQTWSSEQDMAIDSLWFSNLIWSYHLTKSHCSLNLSNLF